MTRHANLTTASTLLGTAVADSAGRLLGRIREFAVSPGTDANHVHAFVLRRAGGGRRSGTVFAEISDLQSREGTTLRLRPGAAPKPTAEEDSFLLLDRDVLDQQIIDIHGHKVVRVNDVNLVWENPEQAPSNGGPSTGKVGSDNQISLRIAEVEVGTRGAVRRLLKGLPVPTVERISTQFKTSIIPWEFVDLIDRDPARRVRLKVEQDRLAKMHPSDLADILEELAPAERQALFTSLDEGTAAEALEEIEPRMQKALTESLDSEKVADIVEEMDPAAAADFLSELPEERSEAILEEMDPDGRQEVEDLLEFADNTAAGEMTTDYISLPETATVYQAVAAVKDFEGDQDALTHIFLVDDQEVLRGVAPLVKLLLNNPDELLSSLSDGHIVYCEIDATGKKVAELFDKYNLRALPVVDNDKKLVGVIYAEQVIAQLRTNA